MSSVIDSLQFRAGAAKLLSFSPVPEHPWHIVFEDEGVAAYCYACDGRLAKSPDHFDDTVLDAMLIYNVDAIRSADERNTQDPARERLATVEWSRSGQQAILRLDGTPQAFVDFAARTSFCRSNFPNFLDDGSAAWNRSSHAWNDDAIARFEAELYA